MMKKEKNEGQTVHNPFDDLKLKNFTAHPWLGAQRANILYAVPDPIAKQDSSVEAKPLYGMLPPKNSSYCESAQVIIKYGIPPIEMSSIPVLPYGFPK